MLVDLAGISSSGLAGRGKPPSSQACPAIVSLRMGCGVFHGVQYVISDTGVF